MHDPSYGLTNIVSRLPLKGVNSVFLKKLQLDLITPIDPFFLVDFLKVTEVRHNRMWPTGL
jgi:hypothetical protein